jgi:hypothetical protein
LNLLIAKANTSLDSEATATVTALRVFIFVLCLYLTAFLAAAVPIRGRAAIFHFAFEVTTAPCGVYNSTHSCDNNQINKPVRGSFEDWWNGEGLTGWEVCQ